MKKKLLKESENTEEEKVHRSVWPHSHGKLIITSHLKDCVHVRLSVPLESRVQTINGLDNFIGIVL